MAAKGALDTYINALPADIRYPIRQALYYLSDNWSIGTGNRAANAQWYRKTGTTPSVANTEFTIAHGLGTTPVQIFPLLDLSQVNSQIVPLTVSRSPDATYVYLKSSSTSAPFTILVEP